MFDLIFVLIKISKVWPERKAISSNISTDIVARIKTLTSKLESRVSIILPKKYKNAVIHKIPKPYKIIFQMIQGISLWLTLKKNLNSEVCFLGSKIFFIICFCSILLSNPCYPHC